MSNKTSDKNVGSIEEDIKIIKNSWLYNDEENVKFVNAIEHLINNYTRQKQINEEHKKVNGELRQAINTVEKEKGEWIEECQQKDKRIQELEEKLLDMIQGTEIINKETPEYVKENYIPKQAVMDELNRHKFAYEEFNKMYDNTHYEDDEKRARDFYMIVAEDRIVQVLQELLEGERK